MLLAGKAACSGIVFILLTFGGLGTTSNVTLFGSKPPQRSASGQESERCQEDTANSPGQRTLPRGARWRLRSPNAGEHSRISEG